MAPQRARGSLVALPLLLAAAATTDARSIQNEYLNDHIIRCNTVNTVTLPEASLAQYGLEADASQGLLTCLVQQDQQQMEPANVAADVRARYRPIGQAWREIPMREVEINDFVSYMGVYAVDRGATLRFEVQVDVPRVGGMRLSFEDLEPER